MMMDVRDKNGKESKEDLYNTMRNVGTSGMSAEIVQRYGEAVKQHVAAYKGVDNESGKQLVKGLKQISNQKINPDFEFQNKHQQAGFSAEVKEVARKNAENIINGNPNRVSRTDDLGSVNDPMYDIVEMDTDGNIVQGSAKQMKFIGASKNDPLGTGDAKRALQKLQSKKYDKYFDADAKISVPSDMYEDILKEADLRKNELLKQLEHQKAVGNYEKVQSIQKEIDRLDKIKSNLEKSSVSRDDAMLAIEKPMLSTAKDIVGISHRAGVEAAKNSAIISGSISIVKNLVGMCKGDIEPDEAIINVAKDTASATVIGYSSAFVGSTLKGIMQNSKSKYIRAVSKTNVPGTIVTVTIETSKTLKKYFKGEIDGVECVEMLGEQGTGMIASSVFAVIGQVAIPIPVIGGMIGGMVGYIISSASYSVLTDALKESKIAHEERIRIEKACDDHVKLLREYRIGIEEMIEQYLLDTTDLFHESFDGIKNALAIGDVDWFIDSANKITKNFGKKVQYNSMSEFDTMMLNGATFKL